MPPGPSKVSWVLEGAARAGFRLRRNLVIFGDFFLSERDRWALWIPVLFGIGIGFYFSLGKEPSLWTPLVLLIGLVAASHGLARFNVGGDLPSIFTRVFLCIVLGFVAAKIRTDRVDGPLIERELRAVTIEGRLKKVLPGSDGYPRLIIEPTFISRLTKGKLPRGIRLSYRGKESGFAPGATLRLRATLMAPPTPVIPHGFDFARQSFFDRIGGVGYIISTPEVLEGPSSHSVLVSLSNFVASSRARLSERLRDALPGQRGAIAAALITGDRTGIPPEKVEALRNSGLAHLLAISGLHMGMAGWAIFALVRGGLALVPAIALRYPIKKIAAVLGLLGASSYLLLSGAPISAQRAYVMLSLVFIAVLLDRPAFTLRMVALAATFILLLQPESLMEAGFQMSFAASTVLVSAYEARRKWMQSRPKGKSFVFGFGEPINLAHWLGSKGARYVGGILLTSLLAGAATAPFAAYHFNQFANYGLAGNLFAVPIMGVLVMPWAVLAILLLPFGLEAWPLAVMGFGIEQILWVAQTVASKPHAVSSVAAWSGPALGTIVLGGLWLLLWSRKWRLGGLAVLGVGLVMAATTPPPDLIIGRDGKNIAVRTPEGMLDVMKARRSTYTVETWKRRAGLANQDQTPRGELEPFSCDKMGCLYHLPDGRLLAHISDARAFPEDCLVADIIVTNLWIPKTCNQPMLTVGMMDVRRGGAHIVRFVRGEYYVTTTRDVRGNRPWVAGG
jgi:competence protein ComEC